MHIGKRQVYKHWKLPNNLSKTNLFLEFLGGWNLVDSDHGQMEESLREAIWQLSEDPYTEFISWPLDRFSFFLPIDGGSDLWWKMPLICLALPCVKLGEYF